MFVVAEDPQISTAFLTSLHQYAVLRVQLGLVSMSKAETVLVMV